ncbi:MAG: PaaI family thioesterase [Bacteroidetes bacterium]|nr:PaaI family thioesterase [Bacteroidota bacterium]
MKNENYRKLKALEGQHFKDTLSKAGKWLNYKLIKIEEGEIEASIHVREEFTNPSENLHGGLIALIADELLGLCFYTLGHETFYTTINLHVDYLYAVPSGSDMRVQAKVLRSGKRMANVECFMFDTENRLIAHATTNLMNTGSKIFNLTPNIS